MRFFPVFMILLVASCSLHAQDRIIQYGSPFLLLSPDARAAGMGSAGSSTTPDYSSPFWNAGKLPFSNPNAELGIDYASLMPAAGSSARQLWLSGYQKVAESHTLGFSLKQLKYGETTVRDENGYEIGPGQTVNPADFMISITYAKKLGDRIAIGISPSYVHSGLAKGLLFDGEVKRAGSAVAVNVGLYGEAHSPMAVFSYGITINNIGSKLSYGREQLKEFLPMNLRLGASGKLAPGTQSSITIVLEATKLLLPTPPVFDTEGNIMKGQNPDKSVPQAIFSSFTDAPGGYKEELKEISPSLGLEYAFREKLFARAGFTYEAKSKGDNRYSTVGFGFRCQNLSIDFSHLQPLSSTEMKNSIRRFGLGMLIN